MIDYFEQCGHLANSDKYAREMRIAREYAKRLRDLWVIDYDLILGRERILGETWSTTSEFRFLNSMHSFYAEGYGKMMMKVPRWWD